MYFLAINNAKQVLFHYVFLLIMFSLIFLYIFVVSEVGDDEEEYLLLLWSLLHSLFHYINSHFSYLFLRTNKIYSAILTVSSKHSRITTHYFIYTYICLYTYLIRCSTLWFSLNSLTHDWLFLDLRSKSFVEHNTKSSFWRPLPP